jgi:Family of unknown function (DUF5641)
MPVEEDVTSLEVLTPGHFLVQRPLIASPERSYTAENPNHLKKWELVQQAQQKFWQSWHREYLQTLQKRPKGFRESHKFQVGDMVLIHESNTPSMKWLVGRIVKVYPGKDGIVRKVEVKTKEGLKTRHVNYLSLLPFIVARGPQNVAECNEDK